MSHLTHAISSKTDIGIICLTFSSMLTAVQSAVIFFIVAQNKVMGGAGQGIFRNLFIFMKEDFNFFIFMKEDCDIVLCMIYELLQYIFLFL